jgi:putative acetyltransferase
MTIVITPGDPCEPQVREMLSASDRYYADLYPAESNHLLDPESLRAPGISFLVALQGDTVCGFGALVDAGGYGEVKRMYVRETARGRGVGKELLARIERTARERRLACLRLETGIRQPEAIQLYRSRGFVEIEPFGDYEPDPLSLFMEKRLD